MDDPTGPNYLCNSAINNVSLESVTQSCPAKSLFLEIVQSSQ